jgi:hypothetical protein
MISPDRAISRYLLSHGADSVKLLTLLTPTVLRVGKCKRQGRGALFPLLWQERARVRGNFNKSVFAQKSLRNTIVCQTPRNPPAQRLVGEVTRLCIYTEFCDTLGGLTTARTFQLIAGSPESYSHIGKEDPPIWYRRREMESLEYSWKRYVVCFSSRHIAVQAFDPRPSA